MSNTKSLKAVNKALTETFILYFKTHAFHWNVTGPSFHSLHVMFEEQYSDMWKALDILAERVRQLDSMAPINPAEIMKNATLQHAGQTPDANEMVKALANDNREIVNILKDAAQSAADAGDPATEDMLIARMQAHDQYAWMLESSIDKAA